ncbi:MAG: carbohydrate ABC transporter permease [Chloroflexi bacterium]|nr:MAG: carbohydrate ABC transporter permease [Chloroflexota bacterium]
MAAVASATPRRSIKETLYHFKIVKRAAIILSVLFFGFTMLFPFFWMGLTSIRTGNDLFKIAKTPFAVHGVTLQHYYLLLTETKFIRWMFNSLFVASTASVMALIVGIIAAYSFGRLRYRGGAAIALLVFSTYLIPPVLLFIPLNVVVNTLKLSNNLWSLILTYQTFMVPFIAWMLAGYFKSIPAELVDAARIDGASRIKAMLVIDLPLILPGVISVFFFAFTLAWNEYLYAFTFIRSSSKLPVAVGVVNALQVGDVYFWGQLMAGAILGSVPVVIIYSFLMDYYLAGLTAGAVKG